MRVAIAVAALFMALSCGRGAVRTFRMPGRAGTPAQAFFSVYFRWMWGLLRVSWSFCYAAVALSAIVDPRAILYCAAWFPASFALAFLIMPLAARIFKRNLSRPSG